LSATFVKEVQAFVKALFLSGQNELQSREADRESERDEDSSGQHRANAAHVNRFRLNVQTNAVCVDVLVWATRDEYGKRLTKGHYGCLAGLISFFGRFFTADELMGKLWLFWRSKFRAGFLLPTYIGLFSLALPCL